MRVQAIKIRNFKCLRDVEMNDIPGFAVLVGANGSGKSTFIGVMDFLKDCLKDNVRVALQKRGGFSQVISRGYEKENIEIEIQVYLDFEEQEKERLVTYSIEITESNGKPKVSRERLRYKRGRHGKPFHFIDFKNGSGVAIPEMLDNFDSQIDDKGLKREDQTLDSPDILAIKGLGQFKRFDAASQLRELIENWTVSDFHITDAKREPDAALAEHLSASGDNLALYAQFLHDSHPDHYRKIVAKMASRVPGVAEVVTYDTGDGRVALRFRDIAFDSGFIARSVSDGTIKMFAYLALLNDPDPHPLLCIEEPENQLYPVLLPVLAEEFAEYAEKRRRKGQVFVTTHSPEFLNAVPLESIYWLSKVKGFSSLTKASKDQQLRALIEEGDKPGELWRQGLFAGADPKWRS